MVFQGPRVRAVQAVDRARLDEDAISRQVLQQKGVSQKVEVVETDKGHRADRQRRLQTAVIGQLRAHPVARLLKDLGDPRVRRGERLQPAFPSHALVPQILRRVARVHGRAAARSGVALIVVDDFVQLAHRIAENRGLLRRRAPASGLLEADQQERQAQQPRPCFEAQHFNETWLGSAPRTSSEEEMMSV
jgi:hypothetical protein